MRRFFSTRRLFIIILIIVISIGLIGGSTFLRKNKSTPLFIQQFGNDVVGFTSNVIVVPARGLSNFVKSTGNLFNTYKENDHLKNQIDKLTSTQVKDEAIQDENKKLREQLKLTKTLTSYNQINATVVSRTPSAWQRQLIIDKGQNSGIKKNMAVVVNKGLVGKIIEVNKNNSKVQLITDNNPDSDKFAVQATSNGKTVNGLISGTSSSSGKLVMGSTTTKTSLKNGNKVITSGLGGITPKGLYVGEIYSASKDSSGLPSKIYIKPATNMNDIDVVTVVSKNE